MFSVLPHPGQVGGFSGHRFNVNHFTQPFSSEAEVKQICSSLPYPIGLSLPQYFQEPWAALTDTGAVSSIALASLTPHVLVAQHSGQLVNVNGGEIKILGQKKITYITRKVVMNITFLIAEDVVNPVVGLDALCQTAVQLHLFQSGKAYLQQKDHRAAPRYFRNYYYSSGLVTQGFVKGCLLQWEDPEYTVFDLQSTNQIIAEIDFEVNSQSRLSTSSEEEREIQIRKLTQLNASGHQNQSVQLKKMLTH